MDTSSTKIQNTVKYCIFPRKSKLWWRIAIDILCTQGDVIENYMLTMYMSGLIPEITNYKCATNSSISLHRCISSVSPNATMPKNNLPSCILAVAILKRDIFSTAEFIEMDRKCNCAAPKNNYLEWALHEKYCCLLV